MSERDDHALLAAYARESSEAAFAALVERYVNLVYSVAWRATGNVHAAEEITQAVFIILAQKAGPISGKTILSGWLHQTARLTAANYRRGEIRRQKREQEAYMQSTLNEPEAEVWRRIGPLLDEALARLGERDRNAIVLRFFENKSLREVGDVLGGGEDAAKMRVNRALEKLRKIFTRRGVTFTAVAIAGAVAANSVQAAPAGLAKSAATVALAKGAAATASTLTLVKGALKIMAWTKVKTAVVITAGALLAAGTTTVTVREVQRHEDSQWDTGKLNSAVLDRLPRIVRIVPTRFPKQHSWVGMGDRKLGSGSTAEDIARAAYGGVAYGAARTLVLAPIPKTEYDFIANLTAGSDEALQREVKARFGVVGRFETVETNVLFLQVKGPNAPGLHPAVAQGDSSSQTGQNTLYLNDLGMDSIASYVEGELAVPIIDQTGLTGHYDVNLSWSGRNDRQHEQLKQALEDQLGLKLVPGTAPIKMLVIEKAK